MGLILILKSKQCSIPSHKYSVWINKLLGKLFQSGWLFVKEHFPFCRSSSHTGFSEWGLGNRPGSCTANHSGLLNEMLCCRSHAQRVWFCSWVTMWERNIRLVNYLTGCLFSRWKDDPWLMSLPSGGKISGAPTALAAWRQSRMWCRSLLPLHLDRGWSLDHPLPWPPIYWPLGLALSSSDLDMFLEALFCSGQPQSKASHQLMRGQGQGQQCWKLGSLIGST